MSLYSSSDQIHWRRPNVEICLEIGTSCLTLINCVPDIYIDILYANQVLRFERALTTYILKWTYIIILKSLTSRHTLLILFPILETFRGYLQQQPVLPCAASSRWSLYSNNPRPAIPALFVVKRQKRPSRRFVTDSCCRTYPHQRNQSPVGLLTKDAWLVRSPRSRVSCPGGSRRRPSQTRCQCMVWVPGDAGRARFMRRVAPGIWVYTIMLVWCADVDYVDQ